MECVDLGIIDLDITLKPESKKNSNIQIKPVHENSVLDLEEKTTSGSTKETIADKPNEALAVDNTTSNTSISGVDCNNSIIVAESKLEPETKRPKLMDDPERKKMGLVTAARSGLIEVVKDLLNEGQDSNQKQLSNTALHFACKYNKLDIVKTLIEHKGDPNLVNLSGSSPLHWAISEEHYEIIDYLLKKGGANPNLRGDNIPNYLHQAVKKGNLNISKLLVESKADILSLEGPEKSSVLFDAVDGKNLSIVQYLISQKADINQKSNKNLTVLHKAASKNQTKIIQAILEAKANINETDEYNRTALHWAVFSVKRRAVKFLIDSGASVNIPDTSGATPIDFGLTCRSKIISDLLISVKSAQPNSDPNTSINNSSQFNNHSTSNSQIDIISQKAAELEKLENLYFQNNNTEGAASSSQTTTSSFDYSQFMSQNSSKLPMETTPLVPNIDPDEEDIPDTDLLF